MRRNLKAAIPGSGLGAARGGNLPAPAAALPGPGGRRETG